MKEKNINIEQAPIASKLIKIFLSGNKLKNFYSFKNDIKNYDKLIKQRSSFSQKKRLLLHNVIEEQYKNIDDLGSVSQSINDLRKPNTFTITTGHQLSLNTGPLYYIYKILHCIKISKGLKEKYSKYNFIPIFWMASEDHDFNEIKSFQTKNRKYEIDANKSGLCTGRTKPLNLSKIIDELDDNFKNKPFKDEVITLFKSAYDNERSLAESTKRLVHSIFKDYGLVIIDADNYDFKSSFKHILEDEISNLSCHNHVLNTNKKISNLLKEKIKFQVNPRKLNLFLIENDKRYRIEYSKGEYNILGTELSFKKAEILKLLNNNPEMFSPNVLMRPVYQEFLLPNLSYVGGKAEIAYWLQLKSLFQHHQIPFPILTLRNSVLLLNKRDLDLLNKNKIKLIDLLSSKDIFIKNLVNNNIQNNFDLDTNKSEFESAFKKLLKATLDIDKSLESLVKSAQSKQLKIFDSIEKKIIKSHKRKISENINSCEKIYDKVYADGIFQERRLNYSEFYSYIGKNMIKLIYESIHPFDNKIIVVEI